MPHNTLMIPVGPNDRIGPNEFGPSLWQGLHYISLGYPHNPTEEQKQKYKTFFLLLQDTLPCSICANHYSENLEKMPITSEVLESKETLVKWLIEFHNIVNNMKGKPVIEYQIARQMIDTDILCKPTIVVKKLEQRNVNMNYNNQNDNIKLIYSLIGILVILVLIAVVYKKK